jgi:hypothetical protein
MADIKLVNEWFPITKSVLGKAKQVYDFCLMKVSIGEIEMAEKENE